MCPSLIVNTPFPQSLIYDDILHASEMLQIELCKGSHSRVKLPLKIQEWKVCAKRMILMNITCMNICFVIIPSFKKACMWSTDLRTNLEVILLMMPVEVPLRAGARAPVSWESVGEAGGPL